MTQPKRGQPRKHKDNAAKQQAYRRRKDERNIVTPYIWGGTHAQHKGSLSNKSAVDAKAHGQPGEVGHARFLQRPDGHDDVLYTQSLASGALRTRLKRKKELHAVARRLLPLQRKQHPNEDFDKLWERALERAFQILNGITLPKERK
jgi:hypothetical protein